MHTARRTFVATGTVAILAAAAVTAAIDADTLDGKHASEFALTSDLDDAVQPGPQGPGGPEGPAGVSGYDHVHELHEVTGGDFELIAVSCPGEKLPLSGGYEIASGSASISHDHVVEYPGGDLAYRVGVHAGTGGSAKVTVHVICAHVD